MFTSLGIQGLVGCLGRIPPVELQAIALLREARQNAETGGGLSVVLPDTIAAATSEIISYTKTCAALISKLAYLPPVILPGLECPTWPL
ncbi:MAG: hypothetical protein ACYDBJ_20790 [Aggregatilineales bacterium]